MSKDFSFHNDAGKPIPEDELGKFISRKRLGHDLGMMGSMEDDQPVVTIHLPIREKMSENVDDTAYGTVPLDSLFEDILLICKPHRRAEGPDHKIELHDFSRYLRQWAGRVDDVLREHGYKPEGQED
jgi:hypothetical protein